MHSAGSSDSSGKDLASFADETAEFSNIFVVDEINFVSAELANFLSGLSLVEAISFSGFTLFTSGSSVYIFIYVVVFQCQ